MLLKGKTVLVLGAFMAHRGYLDLSLVIIIGFLVTFASDQFFFWMGRTHGSQFFEKRLSWKHKVEWARLLIHGNTTLLFIGFRFMYGFRTVLPFVFGLSSFEPKRFAILNLIGAFIWVLFFGFAGYQFGHLMELILNDVSRYETWMIIFILIPAHSSGFIVAISANGKKANRNEPIKKILELPKHDCGNEVFKPTNFRNTYAPTQNHTFP